MPSITTELPDNAYRAALAFTHDERMRLGAIALSAAFTTAEAALEEDDQEETTEEDIAALRISLAEEEAAQVVDGDTFIAELRAKRAYRRTLC